MTIDVVFIEPSADGLSAGEFTSWLTEISAAINAGGALNVPCGECNACCRSAYFIHVAPEDRPALAVIPEPLLFPAPGRGEGQRLLGFDANGCCPMLDDGVCSIYHARPGTCRSYDCRVFSACGFAEPGAAKADVTMRAKLWRFDYEDEASERAHRALVNGARFLATEQHGLNELLPVSATQLAVLAVRLAGFFIEQAELSGADFTAAPDFEETLRNALERLNN